MLPRDRGCAPNNSSRHFKDREGKQLFSVALCTVYPDIKTSKHAAPSVFHIPTILRPLVDLSGLRLEGDSFGISWVTTPWYKVQ
jgi:hypothetical protein